MVVGTRSNYCLKFLSQLIVQLCIATQLANYDIFDDTVFVAVKQISTVAIGAVLLVLYAGDIAELLANLVVVLCFSIEAAGLVLEKRSAVECKSTPRETRNSQPLLAKRARTRFFLIESGIDERLIIDRALVHRKGRVRLTPGVVHLGKNAGRNVASLQPVDLPVADLVATSIGITDVIAVAAAIRQNDIIVGLRRIIELCLTAKRIEAIIGAALSFIVESRTQLRETNYTDVDRVRKGKFLTSCILTAHLERNLVAQLRSVTEACRKGVGVFAKKAALQCRSSAQRYCRTLAGTRILGDGIEQAVVCVRTKQGRRRPEHHLDALDIFLHCSTQGTQRKTRSYQGREATVVDLKILGVKGTVETPGIDTHSQDTGAHIVDTLLPSQQLRYVEAGQLTDRLGANYRDGSRCIGDFFRLPGCRNNDLLSNQRTLRQRKVSCHRLTCFYADAAARSLIAKVRYLQRERARLHLQHIHA